MNREKMCIEKTFNCPEQILPHLLHDGEDNKTDDKHLEVQEEEFNWSHSFPTGNENWTLKLMLARSSKLISFF